MYGSEQINIFPGISILAELNEFIMYFLHDVLLNVLAHKTTGVLHITIVFMTAILKLVTYPLIKILMKGAAEE